MVCVKVCVGCLFNPLCCCCGLMLQITQHKVISTPPFPRSSPLMKQYLLATAPHSMPALTSLSRESAYLKPLPITISGQSTYLYLPVFPITHTAKMVTIYGYRFARERYPCNSIERDCHVFPRAIIARAYRQNGRSLLPCTLPFYVEDGHAPSREYGQSRTWHSPAIQLFSMLLSQVRYQSNS